jgi:hypothetical protein
VLADAGDESIKLLAAIGVVERRRRQQSVGEQTTQTVTTCHIEFLFIAAPDKVETTFDHLLCDGIGQ